MTQRRRDRPRRVTVDSLSAETHFASRSSTKARFWAASSHGRGRTGRARRDRILPLPGGGALAGVTARDSIPIGIGLPVVQSNPLYPKCRHGPS